MKGRLNTLSRDIGVVRMAGGTARARSGLDDGRGEAWVASYLAEAAAAEQKTADRQAQVSLKIEHAVVVPALSAGSRYRPYCLSQVVSVWLGSKAGGKKLKGL